MYLFGAKHLFSVERARRLAGNMPARASRMLALPTAMSESLV
jgi:hypothetical protein